MCSLYKRGKKGRVKCIHLLYNRSIIEGKERAGKVVKVAGKYVPLYI